MLSDTDVDDHYNPTIRLLDIEKNDQTTNCGFHLTRSKWDPYPWVSSVDRNTAAYLAGMKPGDCLLEVNGEDIVGQRISDVADIVKSNTKQVSLLLWNAGVNTQCKPETLCCGPMPTNLQKLSAVLTTILAFLECPICLDTITPPSYQCDNGHLICIRCRAKSERCPVCRQRFNRSRSLIADQIFNSIIEAFNLKEESDETKAAKIQQIFKLKSKNKNIPDIKITTTSSHTNKFLTRIIGGVKSSSVENLTTPAINSIKTKSLSTNEIFQSDTIVSRSGSMTRLKAKSLNINQCNDRPASYHGSFESLNRKIDDIMQMPIEIEGLLFHCPFNINCNNFIKGNNFIEHFQTNHNNGPLIQYFTPNLKLNLKKIIDDPENEQTYMIYTDMNIFFLKICLEKSDKDLLDNILIWTWYLGRKRTSKVNEMIVELKNQLNDLLLSVRSTIFSLNTVSYQEMKDNKKGVYISWKTIDGLNHNSNNNNILDINIITENE